ncbi:MAG: 50S ribosomal protein L11 methyltransferase [Rhodospirillales bacterium]|nr:50S ribosomal protein L11 methyltransferase [Rhodospirillales bacterium]
MKRVDRLWRVALDVRADAAEALAEALSHHVRTVTSSTDAAQAVWRIEGYDDAEPERARIAAAVAAAAAKHGLPTPTVTINRVPPTDWLARNLETFPPVRRGRYFIHGSHYRGAPPAGSIPLNVDAGMAFGSGRHASTSGCLIALDGLARRYRFRRPLDLGSGSGILGIATVKTWRVHVLAADNDPEAVSVTRSNIRRNRVHTRLRAIRSNGFDAPAIHRRQPFDLITSNILLRPLCRLARRFSAHVKPGGFVVLAGLIAEDGNWLLSAYRRCGFRLSRRITRDGWQTLVLRKARSGSVSSARIP